MIVCMLTDTLEHMLRVAVVNQKGGVGKTTVTLGLAGAAQAAGMRVLVVNLDPQANATVGLDVELNAGSSHGTQRCPLRRCSWCVNRRRREFGLGYGCGRGAVQLGPGQSGDRHQFGRRVPAAEGSLGSRRLRLGLG